MKCPHMKNLFEIVWPGSRNDLHDHTVVHHLVLFDVSFFLLVALNSSDPKSIISLLSVLHASSSSV
jgi:hypothetical protein